MFLVLVPFESFEVALRTIDHPTSTGVSEAPGFNHLVICDLKSYWSLVQYVYIYMCGQKASDISTSNLSDLYFGPPITRKEHSPMPNIRKRHLLGSNLPGGALAFGAYRKGAVTRASWSWGSIP